MYNKNFKKYIHYKQWIRLEKYKEVTAWGFRKETFTCVLNMAPNPLYSIAHISHGSVMNGLRD